MNQMIRKLRNNPKDPENILGKRFYHLIPIKYIGYLVINPSVSKAKGYFYQCQCDCGSIRITTSNRLKQKIVRHCRNCKNKQLKEYRESIGKKFNLLTVKEIFRDSTNYKKIVALCDCDCGRKNKKVRLHNLFSGKTKSCGCLLRENSFMVHGLTKKPYYRTLFGINQRCKDPRNYYYFQKGIRVCDEWDIISIPKNRENVNMDELIEHNIKSYKNFESWYEKELRRLHLSFQEARRRKYSVDRIDVHGNYSPENCRLAEPSVQLANRDRELTMKYKDQFFSLSKIGIFGNMSFTDLKALLKDYYQNPEEVLRKHRLLQETLETLFLLENNTIHFLSENEINDFLNQYNIVKEDIYPTIRQYLENFSCLPFYNHDTTIQDQHVSLKKTMGVVYQNIYLKVYVRSNHTTLSQKTTIYLFFCENCQKGFLIENLNSIINSTTCPVCHSNIDKQKQIIRGIRKNQINNSIGLGYKNIFKQKSTWRRFFDMTESPFEHICYVHDNDLIRIFHEYPTGKELKRKVDLALLDPECELYKIQPGEAVFYRYQNLITKASIWADLLKVNPVTFNVQINRALNAGETFQDLIEKRRPEYKEKLDKLLKNPETIAKLKEDPYVQFIEDEDYVVNTYPKSWARLLDLGFTLFLDFSDRLYISRTNWKLSNNSIKNTIVSPCGKQYYSF